MSITKCQFWKVAKFSEIRNLCTNFPNFYQTCLPPPLLLNYCLQLYYWILFFSAWVIFSWKVAKFSEIRNLCTNFPNFYQTCLPPPLLLNYCLQLYYWILFFSAWVIFSWKSSKVFWNSELVHKFPEFLSDLPPSTSITELLLTTVLLNSFQSNIGMKIYVLSHGKCQLCMYVCFLIFILNSCKVFTTKRYVGNVCMHALISWWCCNKFLKIKCM